VSGSFGDFQFGVSSFGGGAATTSPAATFGASVGSGLRTYGRLPPDMNGYRQWVQVSTDVNGSNDMVYVTTLAQNLLLNLGESPFFGDRGIPAHQSVVQQIFPDYYVAYTQRKFAPFFASLIVSKVQSVNPTYTINIITHQGTKINASVPVPT
jgi:hypothetical protein